MNDMILGDNLILREVTGVHTTTGVISASIEVVVMSTATGAMRITAIETV